MPEWAKVYREVRFDIDASHNPDIVGNMVDMGDIGQFDAILCQHALEHLTFKDGIVALQEFRRVLNDGGFAMVLVPDLEGVRATDAPILETPAGWITGIDMIYGWQKSDNPFMEHKSGYIAETMKKAFENAGFSKVEVKRLTNYNLMAIGVK